MTNLDAHLMRNVRAYQKHVAAFRTTFHAPLKTYWTNNFLGFDTVKFCESVVKAPEGVSALDHIKSTWGPAAATMVEELTKGIEAP